MSASDEAPDAAEPSLEVALHESPFGTAWCAKSPTGARQLARVVPTRTPVGRHDVAQLRQRFARAADLQAPQLLPAIDVIERAREVVLISEWADGEPVGSVLRMARGEQVIPPAVALQIVLDLCDGMVALHDHAAEAGWESFGGLCPDAALLGEDGVTRIVEGTALALAATTPPWSKDPRRVPYQAPETLAKSPTRDARSDVYSLAVILWELLANEPAFSSGSYTSTLVKARRGGVPELPDDVVDALPKALVDALTQALTVSPDERQPTVASFALDLRATDLDPSGAREAAEVLEAIAGDKLRDRRERIDAAWATAEADATDDTDGPSSADAPDGDEKVAPEDAPAEGADDDDDDEAIDADDAAEDDAAEDDAVEGGAAEDDAAEDEVPYSQRMSASEREMAMNQIDAAIDEIDLLPDAAVESVRSPALPPAPKRRKDAGGLEGGVLVIGGGATQEADDDDELIATLPTGRRNSKEEVAKALAARRAKVSPPRRRRPEDDPPPESEGPDSAPDSEEDADGATKSKKKKKKQRKKRKKRESEAPPSSRRKIRAKRRGKKRASDAPPDSEDLIPLSDRPPQIEPPRNSEAPRATISAAVADEPAHAPPGVDVPPEEAAPTPVARYLLIAAGLAAAFLAGRLTAPSTPPGKPSRPTATAVSTTASTTTPPTTAAAPSPAPTAAPTAEPTSAPSASSAGPSASATAPAPPAPPTSTMPVSPAPLAGPAPPPVAPTPAPTTTTAPPPPTKPGPKPAGKPVPKPAPKPGPAAPAPPPSPPPPPPPPPEFVPSGL